MGLPHVLSLVVLTFLAGCSSRAPGGEPVVSRAPAVNYATHCQGCHLPDGSGMAGKVPDMRGMLGRFVRLPAGRAYLVQVPGAANSTLNDRETAEVMNWLVKKMGPDTVTFKPYDESEVRKLRSRRLNDPLGERARLIKQFPSDS